MVGGVVVERWETVEPTEACVSPHGHSAIEFRTADNVVPFKVNCQWCARAYLVLTFDVQATTFGS